MAEAGRGGRVLTAQVRDMGDQFGLAQRFAQKGIHPRQPCSLAMLIEDISRDRDHMRRGDAVGGLVSADEAGGGPSLPTDR